jgi:UDP-N-acetylglucosamine 2-epimerase (non-hydrolysing)
MTGRVVVVLGTRPEIVKLAPVIQALPTAPMVVHTGQHYDPSLSATFFDVFGVPAPEAHLAIGGETRGQQIGLATQQLDTLFADVKPTVVVAQGDTNSTLAAALAANARQIPLVHVEAGLRSRDRDMPEEHNRVLTDHLSDLCLAPTETSAQNLRDEGIDENRIEVTGNTVVDAVLDLLPDAEEREAIRGQHDLGHNGYVLSTFHRPENVDDPARLSVILRELDRIGVPVLLPLHPRTRSALARAGSSDLERVRLLDPLGYIEFLALLADSALVVADSGGIQEEVSVVKRPMVVVRKSTERPEVLGTFCSLVEVGPAISETARRWLAGDPFDLGDMSKLPSPYGRGDAGALSAKAIARLADDG